MRRLLLPALLLAGCSSESAPPSGDVLIWARGTKSTNLDPAEMHWGEDVKIAQSLYEQLITFQEGSVELEGGLATKWSFSEDGRTLTFDLRTGVKFHDGTAFDSEAVVFSFRRLLERDHPHAAKFVPYEANFRNIAKVEADGPHRAVMTLKTPSAVILQNLTLFGASVVSPTAVKKHGDRFSLNPVGTGPYRLARWETDVKIELEAFDGYWGKKPAIPRVIVVPVASPQTAVEQLKRGQVHAVDHATLGDVKPLKDHPATRVDIQESLNVCVLGFNMNHHPYSDINFRRAVSLALDRDQLNALVYYGLAQPATHVVPPAIWGDICPTPPYERDLEKAKEFLAKVKLESKTVELHHMSFSRPYVPEPHRVAEWVKDQLRKIGLEVRLSAFEKPAYDKKLVEEDHPMLLLGWNADIADPDNFFFPLLHGDSGKHLNPSRFNDPEFNEAVKAAQSELDPEKRKALYVRAYERYREMLPTLPLVHAKQVTGLSSNVVWTKHPIEYRFYTASLSE